MLQEFLIHLNRFGLGLGIFFIEVLLIWEIDHVLLSFPKGIWNFNIDFFLYFLLQCLNFLFDVWSLKLLFYPFEGNFFFQEIDLFFSKCLLFFERQMVKDFMSWGSKERKESVSTCFHNDPFMGCSMPNKWKKECWSKNHMFVKSLARRNVFGTDMPKNWTSGF